MLHVRVHDGDDDRLPIVLVHGSMDRGSSFAKLVPHLGGRRVVRYDRRGYGRSVDAGPPAGVDGHADDLLEVIDEHADGAAIVVGHSLGAAIVLAAAAARPEAVVAVGAYEMPMPWDPSWTHTSAGRHTIAEAETRGPGAAAEAFLRRMVGDDRWEALSPAQQDERRAEGPALVAELRSMHERSGPPYDLDRIRCAIRTAHGTDSKPHHVAAAQALARIVGDVPTVFDGAQHGAHRSHPEQFAAWVLTCEP
jgi:pimeloyl-ACP methyl ester carboxylesterase